MRREGLDHCVPAVAFMLLSLLLGVRVAPPLLY